MRLIPVIATLGVLSAPASGQGTILVAPGAQSLVRAVPNAKLAVPIVVDMSAAMGANLALFTTGVTWDASRLTLDSAQAAFPALTADQANKATGRATLTFTSAGGNTQTLATLHFTASAAWGGSNVQLQPTVATNENGASLLSTVRARLMDVCVAPSGKWGDVNGDSLTSPDGDGNVNIIDAQQIARYSVNLPVANRPGLVARGDVTADGVVNIIDAQQIARFSVSLSAAFRTATAVAPPVTVASTVVTPAATTLAAGQSRLLVATPKDSVDASLAGCTSVTWVSTNPSVATVDSTGTVVAVSAGAATITASSGGRSASTAVTVALVPVRSVQLTPATGALYTGSTLQLTATPKDSIGGALSGRSVTWVSSDTTIATVSAAGLVIAKSPGTVSVTASSEGVSSATAVLAVALVPVASIAVPSDTGVLFVGRTRTLTATPLDSVGNELLGRVITWRSSDTTIAAVSSAGVVTAVAPGTATVTASSGIASTPVDVRVAVRTVASVTVSPKAPTLIVGDSLLLRTIPVDVHGDTLAGQVTTWSAADPTIATVSAAGVARALAVGTARVIGSTGTRSDTALVYVRVASTATAVANGTDSTVVAVASGSSISVPAGVLPAGTTVRVADVSASAGDADAAIGGAVVVTLTPPPGVSMQGLRSMRSGISGSALDGATLVHLRQTIGPSVDLATSKFVVGVNAIGDEAHRLFLDAVDFTVAAGEAGARTIDLTVSATNDVLGQYFQIVNIPWNCSKYAWSLTNRSNPGQLHDPSRIPVILVHGIQVDKKTCTLVERYDPAAQNEVWSTLLPAITGDELLNRRYEVWVYRYPTMATVQSNADALRQKMAEMELGVPERAVIVAHSMGGLVSGIAMDEDESQRVKELITLNSPFAGSPIVDVQVFDPSQRDQFATCLAARGWGLNLATFYAQALSKYFLSIPGADDLSPKRSTILAKLANNPSFAERLTSYASTFSWAGSGHATALEEFGGCILQARGIMTNDGMIPEISTKVENARDTRTISAALSHSGLPRDAAVGVKAVTDRLRALSNVFRVAISPNPINVGLNQTTKLSVTLFDVSGFKLPSRPVDWSVQPSSVASISQDGILTGLTNGTATVSAVLRVAEPGEGVLGTASLIVQAGSGTLAVPMQLSPVLKGTGVATSPTFQWSPVIGANRYYLMVATSEAALPSDPSAMTCQSCVIAGSTNLTSYAAPSAFPNGGNAAALSLGTMYYWRVKAYNSLSTPIMQGQLSPTSSFTTAPSATPVARVEVTPASPTLTVGQTLQFAPALRDANGFLLTGRTVRWSSTTPSIATINSASGLATAISVGTTNITATSEGKTGTATLTVTAVGPAAVATVTVAPATASIAVGATQQFTATTKDAAGNTLTGRAVVWSSGTQSVATVNSSTGLAAGVAAGTATITATSEGKTGTATLSVTGGGGSLTCSGTPVLGCGLASDQFSQIPTGTFQMGSTVGFSLDFPVHTVTISSFNMQRTEVTQGQWREVMGTNPSTFSTCGDTCPVEMVSWNDIQTFLTTLNARTPGVTYRLPTEAEWEYAARAGTTGETYGTLDAIAWYGSISSYITHAAALKDPNAWGLYDMIGNVYEWVNDWYGPYTSASATNPPGPATGTWRVMRGGSWNGNSIPATAAYRGGSLPSDRQSHYGFRLVRTL